MLACPQCFAPVDGTPASAKGAITPPSTSPNPTTPQTCTGAWAGSPLTQGAFWRRGLALLIDLALLAGPCLLAAEILPLFGAIALSWLYFVAFEVGPWCATPGKRLLKLRVVDVNGVALRVPRATLRFACRFLSALPMGAGYLMALFTAHRQALHDLLASTRVVSR